MPSFRRLIRYGLVLVGPAGAFGCDGDSTPTAAGPPPEPSYSLTLTVPTLNGAQGTSTSVTTLSLGRIAFTGEVALSVENLPTGVSAHLSPASPVSEDSSQLWLSIGAESPTGTFRNLLVRGVASGLLDRTTPLTLTITAPPPPLRPFAVLTLSSATLSITQGTGTVTTTVNVARDNYAGPVTLWIDIGNFHGSQGSMPPGVRAAFAPNPTTGSSSVLTLSVSGAAAPGVYDLWITAEATPGWYVEGPKLRLTITAAPSH